MTDNILGVDVGGTNIKFGIISTTGKIIYKSAFKTASFPNPEDFVEALFIHLDELGYARNITGIGVGAPNGNYYKGTIDFAPNLPWKGIIPLSDIFKFRFNTKAVLSNDANAAAIGEKIFGAGKHFKNFVSITLGTGLGSGIIIDDQLLMGTNGYAGEFGHIRMINNGRKCNCGRYGCLETYASATGVMRTYEELKTSYMDSLLFSHENITPETIFLEAKNNDELANRIIDYTADILGSALADFACFSDPEAFILFGGLANSGDEFAEKVKVSMENNLLTIFKGKIAVRRSGLEESSAALMGAAALYLS